MALCAGTRSGRGHSGIWMQPFSQTALWWPDPQQKHARSDSPSGRNLELWLPTVGSTSVKASPRRFDRGFFGRNDYYQAIVNVKLYVGNLSFSIGDQELREAF